MILIERTFTADVIDSRMYNPDSTVDSGKFGTLMMYAALNYMVDIMRMPLQTALAAMAGAGAYDSQAKRDGKLIYSSSTFSHSPDSTTITGKWTYLFRDMDAYLERLRIGYELPESFTDDSLDWTPWGLTTTFRLTEI